MSTRSLVASWVVGMTVVALAAAPSGVAAAASKTDHAELAKQKLAAIDREVARLREKGDAVKADEFAARAARFRDRLAGKDAPAAGAAKTAEVHVVGVYQAERPAIDVRVTDRPVVLVLCAYNSVKWDVRVAKGATVERIILSGYHDQSLAGDPPAGAKVDVMSVDRGSRMFFYAYKRDSEQYDLAVERIRQLTKSDVTTFQGENEPRGKTFVLAPSNADFQAQRVLAEMEPVYLAATELERDRAAGALRRTRFTAVAYTAIDRTLFTAAVGEFTPLGPIEATLRPAPDRMKHLVIDAKAGVHYAIDGQSVVRGDAKPDPVTKRFKLEKLVLPANLPELSWPCGLAFDAKRQRIVLTSLGGVGHMYALDTAAKGQWSLLGEMGNVDLQAFAYSAKDDCFYGLTVARGEDEKPTILRYDASGKRQAEIKPSQTVRLDRSAMHVAPAQLVALEDGTIAVILPPVPDRNGRAPAAPMRCMLIDPKTGEVTYTGELKPLIEGAASNSGYSSSSSNSSSS